MDAEQRGVKRAAAACRADEAPSPDRPADATRPTGAAAAGEGAASATAGVAAGASAASGRKTARSLAIAMFMAQVQPGEMFPLHAAPSPPTAPASSPTAVTPTLLHPHPLPPPPTPPRYSRCSAILYPSLHCRSHSRCSAIHCLLPHCRSPRHILHPHRLPPLRRLSQSWLPLLLPHCSPPPPLRLPSSATPPHPRHLHLRPRHRPHHRHLLTVTLACCRASGWQPPPSRSSHRGRPCRRLTPTVGASPEPFIPHRATAVHGHRAMCHTRRHTGGTMSASSHGSTGAASTTATHCLRAQQRCSTASATP